MLEQGKHFRYSGPSFVLQFGPIHCGIEYKISHYPRISIIYLLANDNSIYKPYYICLRNFIRD